MTSGHNQLLFNSLIQECDDVRCLVLRQHVILILHTTLTAQEHSFNFSLRVLSI